MNDIAHIKADIQLIESKIAVKIAEVNKLTLKKTFLEAVLRQSELGGDKT